MTTLGGMTVGLAALGGGVGLWLLATPAAARQALARFPRNRMWAWVLTALAMLWSGYLLYHGPLGFLEPYRDWLYALVPISVVLIGVYVDELLAARALGGLLILFPSPLLAAARWHPSPWRYVIIVIAYGMVLKGAALIVAPYWFRRCVERGLRTDRHARLWGMASLGLGVGLAVLGLFAY